MARGGRVPGSGRCRGADPGIGPQRSPGRARPTPGRDRDHGVGGRAPGPQPARRDHGLRCGAGAGRGHPAVVGEIREQVARAARFADELLEYGRPSPVRLRRVSVADAAGMAIATSPGRSPCRSRPRSASTETPRSTPIWCSCRGSSGCSWRTRSSPTAGWSRSGLVRGRADPDRGRGRRRRGPRGPRGATVRPVRLRSRTRGGPAGDRARPRDRHRDRRTPRGHAGLRRHREPRGRAVRARFPRGTAP